MRDQFGGDCAFFLYQTLCAFLWKFSANERSKKWVSGRVELIRNTTVSSTKQQIAPTRNFAPSLRDWGRFGDAYPGLRCACPGLTNLAPSGSRDGRVVSFMSRGSATPVGDQKETRTQTQQNKGYIALPPKPQKQRRGVDGAPSFTSRGSAKPVDD